MSKPSVTLDVRRVSHGFGGKRVLNNVNLQIAAGQIVAIVGPSGCGKSTFMKILAGVLEPTSGNVSLDKNERMSWLKQDQFAYEDQRVLDVVMMGHEEMWKANEEKNAIYMNPDATEEDYMKAAELEGVYAEFDGYTAEARAGAWIVLALNYEAGFALMDLPHHLAQRRCPARSPLLVRSTSLGRSPSNSSQSIGSKEMRRMSPSASGR